jgi:hypothetical protein
MNKKNSFSMLVTRMIVRFLNHPLLIFTWVINSDMWTFLSKSKCTYVHRHCHYLSITSAIFFWRIARVNQWQIIKNINEWKIQCVLQKNLPRNTATVSIKILLCLKWWKNNPVQKSSMRLKHRWQSFSWRQIQCETESSPVWPDPFGMYDDEIPIKSYGR